MGDSQHQRRPPSRSVNLRLAVGLFLGVATTVVLGLFAAPVFDGHGQPATIEICRAVIGRNGPIDKALASYKWDMGQFPDTEEGLRVLFQQKEEVDDTRYNGPYLECSFEELTDPWGNAYEYRRGDHVRSDQGYDLWGWGPDRINDGGKKGSDDIKNWVDK